MAVAADVDIFATLVLLSFSLAFLNMLGALPGPWG